MNNYNFFTKSILLQEINAPNFDTIYTSLFFVFIIAVANFSFPNPSGISGTLVSIVCWYKHISHRAKWCWTPGKVQSMK